MSSEVPIGRIRMNGGTQLRQENDPHAISEYAQALEQGADFPPVTVYDDGETIWLSDGFHRVLAHIEAGRKTITAEIREGTLRDAILHSAGANASHGLRRSNADKQKAVRALLADEEWRKQSDVWIAKSAGVSQPFVSRVRQSQPSYNGSRIAHRGDSTYVMEPYRSPSVVQRLARNPEWQPEQIQQVVEHLKELPETEAQSAIQMVERPGIPVDRAVEALKNLAQMPEEDRKNVLKLARSNDDRDRSAAIAAARGLAYSPDPRRSTIEGWLEEMESCIRMYPSDKTVTQLREIVNLTRALLDEIRQEEMRRYDGPVAV